MRLGCRILALTMVVGCCQAFGIMKTRSGTIFASRLIPTVMTRSVLSFRRNVQGSFRTLGATATNGNDSEQINSEVKTTWTYTPYEPSNQPRPPRQRRSFSTGEWRVPKQVRIPEDKVDLSFVRSSGSGGQNVNKLSTKVELRFHVMGAAWLPHEVRERLAQQQANRINKEGYMAITSQEYRTQAQNRKAVFAKLESLILEAYPRPKERKMRKGVSRATKERNKEFKRKRSNVKKNRGRVDF